jgi:hypothetical protein
MNGRSQMQGGKNCDNNANRFFWDSYWLEIWKNHLCPFMGLNGGTVAIWTQYYKRTGRMEPIPFCTL